MLTSRGGGNNLVDVDDLNNDVALDAQSCLERQSQPPNQPLLSQLQRHGIPIYEDLIPTGIKSTHDGFAAGKPVRSRRRLQAREESILPEPTIELRLQRIPLTAAVAAEDDGIRIGTNRWLMHPIPQTYIGHLGKDENGRLLRIP